MSQLLVERCEIKRGVNARHQRCDNSNQKNRRDIRKPGLRSGRLSQWTPLLRERGKYTSIYVFMLGYTGP